ncbi:hypothetical protein [Flavobacterium columnare]|uniref:Membrane or secreted protein n=1 Tax=Flavobacterium columnare TaxID=996 RepID=A0AAI8CIT0_9FLAO|nr:hypothetical protein [Flavobacterium columnare]AMO20795.1 hypothetical protein UN65_11045 [Flavobacterium columnare]AUX18791.1 hypothetical protein AQ623_11255 [Flavobacterium columnare]QOG57869.1 hypothetical protein HUE29_11105 [Flavobacterium columnare]QOG60593.1 hypothetical protein HUE30_11105 [Flavobacterium columnare]QOG63312.1 hypothetical protein HUE31_11105 [Flavobacterium columnare]
MKKKIILIILLVLPIVIYLIFASATHNQLFLPTISKRNLDLPKQWKSLDKEPVTLRDKITVMGFLGSDIKSIQGNVFNFNQKIYDKYVGFKDFQVVFLVVDVNQNQIKELLEKLKGFTENMSGYHIVFASKPEIQTYYDSFKLKGKLSDDCATSEVFILDKDINHRGRIGKNKEGVEEYKESYNTTSAADLHNEMTDDIKILLREYRLALKRNKNKENFRLHEKK